VVPGRENFPNGKPSDPGLLISSATELGQAMQQACKKQDLTQQDIAGLAHTGNR